MHCDHFRLGIATKVDWEQGAGMRRRAVCSLRRGPSPHRSSERGCNSRMEKCRVRGSVSFEIESHTSGCLLHPRASSWSQRNGIVCQSTDFSSPEEPTPPSAPNPAFCFSKPDLLNESPRHTFGALHGGFVAPGIKYANSPNRDSLESDLSNTHATLKIDARNEESPLNCTVPKIKVEWGPIDSVWEASEDEALENIYINSVLPPFWRFLLLGDGSVTRYLYLLTGEKISVDCFEMKAIGESLINLPLEVELIRGPRLQRQVFLRDKNDVPLVYAASWWTEEEVNGYLNEVQAPIWTNLSRKKIELFRDVRRLYIVNNEHLEAYFGTRGPFWARHYFFYHGGKPLTLIYEVFSPLLEKYSIQ